MTPTLLAISIAYVVMGVLLLSVSLATPFRWWLKAAVIVLTSAFFVEQFFSTRNLLGWPGSQRPSPRYGIRSMRLRGCSATICGSS